MSLKKLNFDMFILYLSNMFDSMNICEIFRLFYFVKMFWFPALQKNCFRYGDLQKYMEKADLFWNFQTLI